ncbi:MAG: PqqD family protein [Gemmatimonadota bacterium]|nr:PqqD family protein [Gemmatimonadota bacterium]MDE3127333.1 PqqD family protein [Gemmatimonadota bacterium]MDE3172463.1 PqqD family protein [Gemmatimonadota bacterium]MDE3215812.1 PqqD family protein [Gemmatimonadota bacterium]
MSAPLSLDSRVIATPDQLSSELAGEVVILSLADGVYYGLDEVGAYIWQRLREPRAVRDIVDDVVNRYAVDRERCEHDLLAFLEDLRAHRLAEVVASESA